MKVHHAGDKTKIVKAIDQAAVFIGSINFECKRKIMKWFYFGVRNTCAKNIEVRIQENKLKLKQVYSGGAQKWQN